MIEKSYTFKTAALSNVVAFAFTGSILGIWYAVNKNWAVTFWVIGISLALLALAAAIEFFLVRRNPEREKIEFSLRSDANQVAPIAGASMIVGWSALKTNFATHEGSLLILVGLLYSLWCIVLAMEARQLDRGKTGFYLVISHLLVPAAIGLALAYFVDVVTRPTPDQARQDACYNARVAFIDNQCKPIEPLDPLTIEKF